MGVIRQGDVILTKLELTANEATKISKVVEPQLRMGGETGHKHILDVPVRQSADGRQLVVVEKETVLEHEEHNNLPIEPGVYSVSRVRDYGEMLGKYEHNSLGFD